MSFWSDPSASFEQLGKDPWHSMENFATTGLVPLIPMVASYYGGPVAGGLAQNGIDYFSGNSEARTGKGILGSFASGFGKGYLGNLGASYGGEYLGSLGGESSGGMLDSIGGDGGTFGGDLFQLDGSNGVGDVWSGWSPTGSSASGDFSTLSPSSSNPMAYNDPYAAQDVMQQARDTSAPSGSPESWDTGSKTSFLNSSFAKQLGKQLAKSNLGSSMQQSSNYHYQEQPVQRQGAFAPTPAPFKVQDKDSDIAALIAALRKKEESNG